MAVKDSVTPSPGRCAFLDFERNGSGRLERCPRVPEQFACFCDLHNDDVSVRRRNAVVKATPAALLKKLGLRKTPMALSKAKMQMPKQAYADHVASTVYVEHSGKAKASHAARRAEIAQPSIVGADLGYAIVVDKTVAPFPATATSARHLPLQAAPADRADPPSDLQRSQQAAPVSASTSTPDPRSVPVQQQPPPPNPWKQSRQAWAAGAWSK